MDLLIVVISLIVCYFTGNIIEDKHYKSIKQRELQLYRQPYINFSKHVNMTKKVKQCKIVSASVCIGCDYFKAFLAGLRNIFGGNVSCYESVLDRARREAILRIREIGYKYKANIVVNVKVDTVMLVDNNKAMPKVCVIASGTAIQYE